MRKNPSYTSLLRLTRLLKSDKSATYMIIWSYTFIWQVRVIIFMQLKKNIISKKKHFYPQLISDGIGSVTVSVARICRSEMIFCWKMVKGQDNVVTQRNGWLPWIIDLTRSGVSTFLKCSKKLAVYFILLLY